MLGNIFGRGARVVDETGGSVTPRKNRIIIIAVIIAILVLVFSPGKEQKKTEKLDTGATEFDIEAYGKGEEERLRKALSDIKGAGEVDVMISFSAVHEKVLAENTKISSGEERSGDKTDRSSENEKNIMLYGSGSSQQPYILKELLPMPTGVLVTASGAAEERVRLEIYEAVRALYGISGHRIKVSMGEKLKK